MKKFVYICLGLFFFSSVVLAEPLEKPVLEVKDLDLDTCAYGKVTGLNPSGDNFLAVRTGPGSSFKMIDKLGPDTPVWMFNTDGDWIGIVYGSENISCSPVKETRPYTGPGKKGWVHKKYVTLLAG